MNASSINNEEDSEHKEENTYFQFFVPMMLSMSLNQPLRFWEMRYIQEKENFLLSTTLEQQLDSLFIWFGQESLEISLKVIKQLPLEIHSSILDLGCGNGHFCEMIYAAGYQSIIGSDFSATAINLAQQVRILYKKEDDSDTAISYVEDDILNTTFNDNFFHLVYDKGTFDSISMVGQQFTDVQEKVNLEHKYAAQVNRILKPGNFFLLLSCSKNKSEQKKLFEEFGFELLQDMSDLFINMGFEWTMLLWCKKKQSKPVSTYGLE